jgi:NADH-quinone oxidoreductase subunit N
MELTLSDLYQNLHLIVLTVVGFLIVILEGTKQSRAEISFWVALAGVVIVLALTAKQLGMNETTFQGMIQTGGFAAYFAIVFLVVTILTILLSRPFLRRMKMHLGEFYALVIFACLGMMLMAAARDLIIVFLGIELMSICLYVMAGFFRSDLASNESGVKYFLLGAFATGFLLYGIALVYGATGTTSLDALREHAPLHLNDALFLIGAGMLIVAFSFKVAAVPFHMWAPDVYQGAPTVVTAFMSTGAKAAAFAVFINVFMGSMQFTTGGVQQVIALIAAASMIVGNITAVVQSNLKRMLAYSSIAHAGYMLAGVAAGNPEGQTGILFYVAAYAVMNLGAFGIVSMMEREEGRGLTFDDYLGLSAKRPALAAMMALFMFSLSGIPPLAGFFGKYYVFLAAVKADLVWLAIIGVLTSVISVYYYLRLVVVMYFRTGDAELAEQPSPLAVVAVGLAAILVLQLGLYPSVIVNLAQGFH